MSLLGGLGKDDQVHICRFGVEREARRLGIEGEIPSYHQEAWSNSLSKDDMETRNSNGKR